MLSLQELQSCWKNTSRKREGRCSLTYTCFWWSLKPFYRTLPVSMVLLHIGCVSMMMWVTWMCSRLSYWTGSKEFIPTTAAWILTLSLDHMTYLPSKIPWKQDDESYSRHMTSYYITSINWDLQYWGLHYITCIGLICRWWRGSLQNQMVYSTLDMPLPSTSTLTMQRWRIVKDSHILWAINVLDAWFH